MIGGTLHYPVDPGTCSCGFTGEMSPGSYYSPQLVVHVFDNTERIAPQPPTPSPRANYTLTLITTPLVRTHWWKPSEDYCKEPANVWWLTGGGESRLATLVEIELWKRMLAAEAICLMKLSRIEP
jgi:hypothetical protein